MTLATPGTGVSTAAVCVRDGEQGRVKGERRLTVVAGWLGW
jgi:hypothetical protein